MSAKRILVLNLGSTSTKIAVFQDGEAIFKESVKHSADEIKKFADIWDQYDYRKNIILEKLKEKNVGLTSLCAVASRGGNTKPIPGGIYFIDEKMIMDMKSRRYGTHPTNVGCAIALDLGKELGIPVLTVDPPVTDEFCNLARYSGLPIIRRMSSFHALNSKATAKKIAEKLGKKYEEINMIVVHLGGGISVGAHKKGKVIDANNSLDGDGPFSPERAGSLPTADLVRLCFSGKYTEKEILQMLTGKGGLVAYLGTNNCQEVEERIDKGDEKAREVYEAMAYQVSKEIGSAAAVLKGDVQAIALTGSLAYSERFVNLLKERVSFIAPIYLYPGENEMEALAEGVFRFLSGQEQAKIYEECCYTECKVS
ncbi:MAG: butyrate kinase [Tepidanaerobacteraceae bacterium]|nr:butyrate kinase [Tepidanaerobacteraceae bacterium]